jgi:predicted Fe-S protein YdhL (DUF1289 family)
MSWMCPDCQRQLDEESGLLLAYDLREGLPPPGRCWGCGRRRLEAVADESDDQERDDGTT